MPVGFSSALQQTVIYQSGIRAPQQALPYALASADFDGDGNDDLIISTIEEAGVLFARGFPNGTFASPFIPIIPRSVFSLHDLCQIDMTVGDFNGDGKPDIALSNLVASGNCGEGVTQTAQSLKIYTFLNIMAWPTTTTSVTSSSTTMFELTNTTSSSTTSTPTTETHTTSSPTTETPTTSMPTTDTPTTSAPTTETPTTSAPTTAAPTTETPTAAPTTAAPTASVATTNSPDDLALLANITQEIETLRARVAQLESQNQDGTEENNAAASISPISIALAGVAVFIGLAAIIYTVRSKRASYAAKITDIEEGSFHKAPSDHSFSINGAYKHEAADVQVYATPVLSNREVYTEPVSLADQRKMGILPDQQGTYEAIDA